jgi:hypothetical protein
VATFILPLACTSLLGLLASSFAYAQPAPDKPKYVFRVEARPPAEIFLKGIENASVGLSRNVLDHISGRSCDSASSLRRSAWVSTTSDRSQAERFLRRQFEQAPQQPGTPMVAWLYTVRTDEAYVQVENVVRRVIQAGWSEQQGYTRWHADSLEHLLATSAITRRAEVLGPGISRWNIQRAERATYVPNAPYDQRIQWGAAQYNDLYREPEAEMNDDFYPLRLLAPFNSENFSFATMSTPSCFQTCDGARPSRSQANLALDYCPAELSMPAAFIGSED